MAVPCAHPIFLVLAFEKDGLAVFVEDSGLDV